MVAFAGVAAEFNPLSVDETYAKRTHFGSTVVPGTMIAAIAVGLGSLDVPLPANAGMVGMGWKFLHPVRPGDSIRAHFRLNRKRPVENAAWGLCFWQLEVENQNGQVVATGEVSRLVERRVAASADHRFAPDVRPAAATIGSTELPEPAPADVPSAARRRRRRGGRGRGGNGGGHERDGERDVAAGPPGSASPPAPGPAPLAPGAERRSILRRLFG